MPLLNAWFKDEKEIDGSKTLWMLSEKSTQRAIVFENFCTAVRAHYDDLNNIADTVAELGYPLAGSLLKERLPTTKTAMSGELGEIMAAEFVEEYLGYTVPIKRIRYKDGREMALRGDDFIGLIYDANGLALLKGESKSRAALSKTTIDEARRALDRDGGRCTPISLLFVADRLLEKDGKDKKMGKILRAEVAIKKLKPAQIAHAFFTLSGNNPKKQLTKDLSAADKRRKQNVINICIADHQNFIEDTYKKVADLGNC
jgi:hypothetical protein